MQIDKARRVRDLAQEVVQLIDAATARAHRDREATNAYWTERGAPPLTDPPELAYTPESSALRRRSLDLTRALAELRKSPRRSPKNSPRPTGGSCDCARRRTGSN